MLQKWWHLKTLCLVEKVNQMITGVHLYEMNRIGKFLETEVDGCSPARGRGQEGRGVALNGYGCFVEWLRKFSSGFGDSCTTAYILNAIELHTLNEYILCYVIYILIENNPLCFVLLEFSKLLIRQVFSCSGTRISWFSSSFLHLVTP